MASFEVVGYDETVENVDVFGVIRAPGEIIEVSVEDAQPLVDAGILREVAGTPVTTGETPVELEPVEETPVSEEASEVVAGEDVASTPSDVETGSEVVSEDANPEVTPE
jgi:hypothetical protein